MSHSPRRSNRGPAVAAENRAALLDAAKRLFAARGFDVPLSAIAREAGVGQGVLYRHFPTRLELAFAVFEGHFQQYAALAQDEGPEAFGNLWRALIDNLIAETAFVDMVVSARTVGSDYDGIARLRGLLTAPLRRAIAAGLIEPGLTVDDVILAVRMAYGIIRTTDPATEPGALRDTILGAFPRLRGNRRPAE
ncbi:MAG TPA: helix-turn-helix domain-containing protein [Beutenbergiaceae bacterium]|nr:helix-turn-helix domain-containing protein [Beutenbergiaceae bacterium]